MVQKTGKSDNEEPQQRKYEKPSENEHLFQVVDVYDIDNNEFNLDLGPDDVSVKCEVVGGEEEGRSILIKLNLDDTWKGFFATRLFLKAISEPYKGEEFPIDSDNWIGRQFYATVVHNPSKDGKKSYANIDEYNYEKKVEQQAPPLTEAPPAPADNGNTAAPTEQSEAEKAWDE